MHQQIQSLLFIVFVSVTLSACGPSPAQSDSTANDSSAQNPYSHLQYSSELQLNGEQATDQNEPQATANSCGSVNSNMNPQECEILRLINLERSPKGLRPLIASAPCTMMAQSHSLDMATNNYFSHTSPGAGDMDARGQTFQVGGTYGENIAYASFEAAQVVALWMSSKGHRENILNPEYVASGVGIANSASSTFYTQCFTSQF